MGVSFDAVPRREFRRAGGRPGGRILRAGRGPPAETRHTLRINVTRVPWFTSDLPGTGGTLRSRPEDFQVTELPLYEPSGTGDHAYLLVEKRGVSTLEARTRIGRALDVRPRDIGYAGLKDRHAVTRQTFSIEHVDLDGAAETVDGIDGLHVLGAARHGNKLRLGHLRGNRFDIVVRGVGEDAEARARAVLERLAATGCPNWFGEQRFGMHGDNHEKGAALVRGEVRAASFRGAQRSVLRLLVSAFQSALFNRILERRLEGLGTLRTGDLAWLHGRGAVFLVEDLDAEQPRADRFEISASGPLIGLKSRLAEGEPGRIETEVLAEAGVTGADFKVPGVGRFDGARRPLRVPVTEWDVSSAAPDADGLPALRIRFDLPKGSYATAVLHEVRKPSTAQDGPSGSEA